MDLLERYLAGEHERVWSELQALGSSVRDEPHLTIALAVADETMRRVRRNCEAIISRLAELGYEFGRYPDGSDGYSSEGPLRRPDARLIRDQEAVEARVGPIPLSLDAFWREVGSVDLVGMGRGWPAMLDPLVVYPPEAALVDLDDWEEETEFEDGEQFVAGLAPDALHKDNVSGGAPYGAALPDESADFLFRDEVHGLMFVSYLRLAILQWGGFPGLDGRQIEFPPLAYLSEGLEPF